MTQRQPADGTATYHGSPASSSDAAELPAFTFAFQPIVDAISGTTYSYEALIRGRDRETAPHVLGRVPRAELHRFDAGARLVAIELAARLGVTSRLNLNCLPTSLMAGLPNDTIETAARCGLAMQQIILEVTEDEVIVDQACFGAAAAAYRESGMLIAVDDFGAGYAGLNLLADFQPDIVKLDMKLVRNIHSHGPRQAIVRAIAQACGDLGIDIVAEGIESPDEYRWLRRTGVTMFQGYLFARPGFECLPPIEFTDW